MRVRQTELMILIRNSKGGETRQNDSLVQNLAQKCNIDKEPSQRGFKCGYEILCRFIDFGSPGCYAQFNNITSDHHRVHAVKLLVEKDIAQLDVVVVDRGYGREVQVRDALHSMVHDGQTLTGAGSWRDDCEYIHTHENFKI
jgi:hypothetical protein